MLRVISFHGKVGVIGVKENKLRVGKRVFVIMYDTRNYNAKKSALSEDGAVGENANDSYKMAAVGKMEATTIRFAVPGSAEAKKE